MVGSLGFGHDGDGPLGNEIYYELGYNKNKSCIFINLGELAKNVGREAALEQAYPIINSFVANLRRLGLEVDASMIGFSEWQGEYKALEFIPPSYEETSRILKEAAVATRAHGEGGSVAAKHSRKTERMKKISEALQDFSIPEFERDEIVKAVYRNLFQKKKGLGE